MTRSTPARLYQLRSNSTISPSRRQVLDVGAGKTTGRIRRRQAFPEPRARTARVHMLHKSFDGAAFTGRVAPLKQYDDPLPQLLHPRLELEQLCLQLKLLCFVAPCEASCICRGNRRSANRQPARRSCAATLFLPQAARSREPERSAPHRPVRRRRVWPEPARCLRLRAAVHP